jgi:hypothetical protein
MVNLIGKWFLEGRDCQALQAIGDFTSLTSPCRVHAYTEGTQIVMACQEQLCFQLSRLLILELEFLDLSLLLHLHPLLYAFLKLMERASERQIQELICKGGEMIDVVEYGVFAVLTIEFVSTT